MLKLEIFDPPMCCSTGICGGSHDPTLVTFASDLEWLKSKGVEIVRHGISFEPAAFVSNEVVKTLINTEGNGCLPLFVIGSEIVLKGRYPSRGQLADICKINFDEEEAPPVHREENCCCGVDCDCRTTPEDKNDGACSTAPAEDNCYCGPNCVCHNANVADKWKKIVFVIFMIIILAIIAVTFWGKSGAVKSSLSSAGSVIEIKYSQEVV